MAEPARDLGPQSSLEPIEIPDLDMARLGKALEPEAYDRLLESGRELAELFWGRRLWQINSTAEGGGVAELLGWALPLLKSAGVDVRRLVLSAPTSFFELTKRIHHLLHESERPLRPDEQGSYEACLADAAEQLSGLVRAGDVVVVHDPQPAGLIPPLSDLGAAVVWRCHVGTDQPGELARRAQDFLGPYVEPARAIVFSRRAFVWPQLPRRRVRVIQPAIDPLAPKNLDLETETVEAILGTIGVRGMRPEAPRGFQRADGSPARVVREAEILQEAPVPVEAPLVTQISRWDPLKDPIGVIDGFVDHVPAGLGAHLVLAGPAVKAVGDDPEGMKVLDEVRERWGGLPAGERARVHIVSLPMDDAEENAAMVNALQRGSTVVVQKSLREGFGLTVAEALWKSRPIVASRVGGIQDQIEDGVSGLLLEDPRDLTEFGRTVAAVLGDADLQRRLGRAARRRVCDQFLPDRLAADWLDAFRLAMVE